MDGQVNNVAFFSGNISDDTGLEKEKIYKIKANVTDTFSFSMDNLFVTATFFDKNEKCILFESTQGKLEFIKNEIYFIKIKSLKENQNFILTLTPVNNKLVTPYEIIKPSLDNYSFNNIKEDILRPATIKMKQRDGGTYLYSNMPESLPDEVINTIIMRNLNLTGECFLTFEHRNTTSINNIYMGYRLTNLENHDVYITITNLGYQTTGSWLGEKSWMDYYGINYPIEFEKFKTDTFIYEGKEYNAREWFNDYLNFDDSYQPNPLKPVTYKLPAGEKIYIIGGTTQDNYKNLNIAGSADKKIGKNSCVNGNIKFIINNGSVMGDLVVYDDINKINLDNVKIQNVRKYGENDDFGGRLGYSPFHGVIDNNPVWQFNDYSASRKLPVYYQSYYADELKDSYEPFEKVANCYNHDVYSSEWKTHLSAQLNHGYVGTDMVNMFAYYNEELIEFSNYIANPAGKIWDYGNWMIEYQENCSFINHGSKDRNVKFHLVNGSCLFYIIKDNNNNILKSGMQLLQCMGDLPIYETVIPAHSKVTISVNFVLPANTNGSVIHYIELI